MFRINYTQECTVTMTSRSMFPGTYRNLTWKYQSPAQHPDAPTIPSNICHFWHPTFWPLHPDMLCRPVEKLCPISALPPLPIIKQMYIYKWQCFYSVCMFISIHLHSNLIKQIWPMISQTVMRIAKINNYFFSNCLTCRKIFVSFVEGLPDWFYSLIRLEITDIWTL